MASTDFTKLVPGFDFLQNLMQGSRSAGIPNISQWIAPTLDPAEIEKRINELRTVQFWLEQNARMLAATIQALEVQRMTLSTLKTMNMPLADMREALKLRTEAPAAAPAAADAEAASAPLADPMQWWSALTQQFTELASNAMKDGSAAAAATLAHSQAAMQSAVETQTDAAAAPPPPNPPRARKSAAAGPARKRR